jgi:hypothetical protein
MLNKVLIFFKVTSQMIISYHIVICTFICIHTSFYTTYAANIDKEESQNSGNAGSDNNEYNLPIF